MSGLDASRLTERMMAQADREPLPDADAERAAAERDAANAERWDGPGTGHPSVVRREAQRAARAALADHEPGTWSADLTGTPGVIRYA